jgi:hypothetical protein
MLVTRQEENDHKNSYSQAASQLHSFEPECELPQFVFWFHNNINYEPSHGEDWQSDSNKFTGFQIDRQFLIIY